MIDMVQALRENRCGRIRVCTSVFSEANPATKILMAKLEVVDKTPHPTMGMPVEEWYCYSPDFDPQPIGAKAPLYCTTFYHSIEDHCYKVSFYILNGE